MPDAAFKTITDNAFTFLRHAHLDIGNRPNQLAIGVYSAVELILKARLLHEHWALIVNKDPDRTKFENGDFVSVTFEEACKRLRLVLRDPVPEESFRKFDELRKLRNKAVHFAPHFEAPDYGSGSGGSERSTKTAALAAWEALHNLMLGQWSSIFADYREQIERIEEQNRNVLRSTTSLVGMGA